MTQSFPDADPREPPSFRVTAQRYSDTPRPAPTAYGPEDFPGCESFHLPASEISLYEGRLEFWDGDTETARSPSASAARPPLR